MSTCTEIDDDVLYDCTKPPLAGQFDEILVIPKRVIESYTTNVSNHLIVEAITIASGARGFTYKGNGTLLKRSYQGIKDDYGTRYTHTLPYKVASSDPDTMLQLEALATETEGLVIVGKQNYKGTAGNAKYYILGKDCGVQAIIGDPEGRNIVDVVFASMEGAEEPSPPSFLFLTSETVTDDIYESYGVVQTP